MTKTPSRCKNILIVEDERDIRQALVEVLEDEGYHVYSACDGRQGLALLGKIEGPCLVLLDFMMPVMDGREFLAAKTHNHTLASIPVVVVSAYEDQARTLPSSGFVKKPIDIDNLLEFVRRFCGEGRDQDDEGTVP